MIARVWNGVAKVGNKILRERMPTAFGFTPPNKQFVQLADYEQHSIQNDFKRHLFELGLWSHDPDHPRKTKFQPPSEVEKAWNAVDAVWGDQYRRASKDGDPHNPEPVMNHFAYVGKQAIERLTYRQPNGQLALLEGLSKREFQTVISMLLYHDTHEDNLKHPDPNRRGLFPLHRYAQIHKGAEADIDVARLTRNVELLSSERNGVDVPSSQYYSQLKSDSDWMVIFGKMHDGQHNVVTLGGLNYKTPHDPVSVCNKRQSYIENREGVAWGGFSMASTLMSEDAAHNADDNHFAPWKVLYRSAQMLEAVCQDARIKYNVPARRISHPNGSVAQSRPFSDSGFKVISK